MDFSQHKFASNVVEKCLQYASKRDRDEMIWTIINVTFDLKNPVDAKTGHCVLESMVRDPYANYVVQKVRNFEILNSHYLYCCFLHHYD